MTVKKQLPVIKRSPFRSNPKASDVRRGVLAVAAGREARRAEGAGAVALCAA